MKKSTMARFCPNQRVKFWYVSAVNENEPTFFAYPDMRKTVCIILAAALPLLSACDRLADMLELPDPTQEAADAEAIGSACRQTGRSIEDCYALNPDAQKAAVFLGWKSMNDYMMEHNLKEVPSVVARNAPSLPAQPPQLLVPPAPQPQVAAH